METKILNVYGDHKVDAGIGHGIDVASQRADDLDQACLDFIAGRIAARQDASAGGVTAIDVGCGQCGQGLRMARAGAKVLCLDVVDQFGGAEAIAAKESLSLKCNVADIRMIGSVITNPVDVIVCQRTLHYLDAADAIEALMQCRSLLLDGGKIFVSASGIHSELGQDYAGKGAPLLTRKAPLSQAMREKHNILEPVCLYSEEDMEAVLSSSGFVIEKIFSSAFGNIKAIATVA